MIFSKNEALYWQYIKQENPHVKQRSGFLYLSEIVFIAACYKKSQLHYLRGRSIDLVITPLLIEGISKKY